ncbi:hypothetical protein E2C01_029972 [Portunus trituberculatus]|uniref:Uncharacterized protein n=1 Tax=Portunus trituberculatus TaxID=210409 RepID=A0A5B7EQT6_PORTR|nr:hypothetical protein [Portunus trituberculatus]
MSCQRAATEAGVKVDLREEKIKIVREGLKSQAKENEERGEENIRQWKGAVALGAGVPPPEWSTGRGPSPTTNMKAASDLRQMLRSDATKKTAPPPPPVAKEVKRVETNDDDVGPFNFRQMLRKTNYAPTDTIRKRQLKRDGHNGYGAEYQM